LEKIKKNMFQKSFFFLLIWILAAGMSALQAQEIRVIEGKVTSKNTGKPLPYVLVKVQGTNISSATNLDGQYVIKFPASMAEGKLEFSLVGYFKHEISLSVVKSPYNVQMNQEAVMLEEVDISVTTPTSIVKKAVEKISSNYYNKPTSLTAFYREIGDLNYSHGRVAEAVVEVYKSPYSGHFTGGHEDVKMLKGREVGVDDSLAQFIWSQPGVMRGGPVGIIQQDIAKHPNSVSFLFIRSDYIGKYDYKLIGKKKINGRDTYILKFDQKNKVKESLYKGEMMIDTETFAIVRLEYKLSDEHLKDAVPFKYQGIEIKKIEDYSVIEYTMSSEGKWFLAYTMQGETYEATATSQRTKAAYAKTFSGKEKITIGKIYELFTTGINTEEVKSIPNRERLTLRDVVYDRDQDHDFEFWENYNFVKMDESLRKSFEKR
jgi:hypothetical protein